MDDSKFASYRRSLVAAAIAVALTLCSGSLAVAGGGHGHGADDAEPEPARGPHGGRLLLDGDFALEITIFEHGVPPEYRVYAFDAGEPVENLGTIDLAIELRRLGGRADVFQFRPVEGYLLGDGVVEEPHSFDVTVNAVRNGVRHRWDYPSYEGRVSLTPAAIARAGIVVEPAGPAVIRTQVTAYGRVNFDGERLVRLAPRYAGLMMEARKRLGDRVSPGEVVAIVESNESLQRYEIRSSIGGTVIEKRAAPGSFVAEGEVVYTVADLSRVWLDFYVPTDRASDLRPGQTLEIGGSTRTGPLTATLDYVSPITSRSTQATLARAEFSNSRGVLRPGSFVSARITVEQVEVPLAVRESALQRFRDWDVVFVNEGEVFEVAPLELGRRDGEWVEVLSGLEVGRSYAADNVFILKADLEKSGASHDH